MKAPQMWVRGALSAGASLLQGGAQCLNLAPTHVYMMLSKFNKDS